ncbi:MAG: hypothetical protein D3924_14995 [Candidatus Electrothrix sp. AR4]|nr:hypothetical protein [Candidatus Electrothrix sp. AR4]
MKVISMLEVFSCNESKVSDIQPMQGWNINPEITQDRMEQLLGSSDIISLIEEMQIFLKNPKKPSLSAHPDFHQQGGSSQS